MAQNQIRKGFFFYFGLLILFLVTLSLIFLVVLIFSPNKDFIGLRYFSYTNHSYISQTSGDEPVNIDYSTVKSIEIDCGYADVSLKKGNGDDASWRDGIHINNDAKGFTTAADAIDFTYNATLENGKLVVKLTEPTGFMYFSKNIKVVIYASANSNFLDGKELIVKTADDGNIFLGEALHANTIKSNGVTIAKADIKTEKGNIYVSSGLVFDNGKEGEEHKTVESLELYSGSGSINYRPGQQCADVLNIPKDCAVKLRTANGRIDFSAINGSDLIVECDNGSVRIDTLNLTGDCKVHSKQGNFTFKNVTVGKLDFTTSENTMISPDIDILETLTGDLILSNATAGASPNVVINKVIGNVNIISTDGSLKIKDSIEGTLTVDGRAGSFSVEAGIANVEGQANFNIQLKNGHINLNLKNTINNNANNNLATEKGNITLNMTSEAKFEAQATLFNGNKKTDKIQLSSSFTSLNDNVLTVNGGTSTDGFVKLSTDENIKLNLVASF